MILLFPFGGICFFCLEGLCFGDTKIPNNFHHWLDGQVGVHRLYFLWTMHYGFISLGGGSGRDGLPELPFTTTLPETNIAPENEPLEKEIPIGNHHF